MSGCLNDWSGKLSWVQNACVSKCLDLYAVAQCLGGIMSGWQNVLLSKCLGAKISCSHNVWVSKRGVSKCPGVKMSGAKMSQNLSGGTLQDSVHDSIQSTGFGVRSTGYRVRGTGYRVWGTGYSRVLQGITGYSRVQQGTGYKVRGTGYSRVLHGIAGYSRVQQGTGGYRVQEGTGYRVRGTGYRRLQGTGPLMIHHNSPTSGRLSPKPLFSVAWLELFYPSTLSNTKPWIGESYVYKIR